MDEEETEMGGWMKEETDGWMGEGDRDGWMDVEETDGWMGEGGDGWVDG